MSVRDSLLYLTQAELSGLGISPPAMADEVETLLRACSAGEAWNLTKTAVNPDPERLFMSTLSVADTSGLAACKSLGLNVHNPERGIAPINALITVFDSTTGEPLAVMDGNWITGVRTAAISAVAARQLANPDASVAAFIGCGVQARTHLDAFASEFGLREIRAFGRGTPNRDRLCEKAESMGLAAVASASAREALEGADLVITTVPHLTDAGPFLDASWLPPGAFAAMVDLSRSWQPETLTSFDRLYIEDLPQERSFEKPMVDLARVDGDLGDLVAPGGTPRQSAAQRTAFAFRGLAIGDLALATLAYRAATERAVGTVLPR